MKISNKRIRKLSIDKKISIQEARIEIENSRTGKHDTKKHQSKKKSL
jgi:hypothetical protein